jgi:hypothetical protein
MWPALGNFALKIVFGIGLLAALIMGANKRGRAEAKADVLEKTLKVKNAQQKAAADSPRTRDELADKLQDGSF